MAEGRSMSSGQRRSTEESIGNVSLHVISKTKSFKSQTLLYLTITSIRHSCLTILDKHESGILIIHKQINENE
jgi:hypothetical protein